MTITNPSRRGLILGLGGLISSLRPESWGSGFAITNFGQKPSDKLYTIYEVTRAHIKLFSSHNNLLKIIEHSDYELEYRVGETLRIKFSEDL